MFSKSIIVILLIIQTALGSIYELSVTSIDGDIQSLSNYQGKKLLIVTLPIFPSASSDSFLFSLDTLALNHAADLKVIASPSFEDGYTASQKIVLRNWYRSKLGNHIIITDGVYTRKSAGNLQHPLYKWLTDLSLNERFDMDITEEETKFFINRNGKIQGVLRKQTKIWGRTINNLINTAIN